MPEYPFAAVAGQDLVKRALILAAINPAIDGVLVSGPRGSAKSTLARGLADLLPGGDSSPFVTLPLGATEDRLLGTLDLQEVLDRKQVAFAPGLLARAHGGVLYVDEVNLLPDPLIDLLLDVAASGINRVERDGISHTHAADFLLVGTMNPDEGELRPQLQDRFGLVVQLDNVYSVAERIEIVRRRESYDADPERFCQRFNAEQRDLAASIQQARGSLPGVTCPDPLRECIAERCHAAGVEGLRADIAWCRAALAHAAWAHRDVVAQEDIDAVADLVLALRRQAPPTPPPFSPPPGRPPPPGRDPAAEPAEGNSTSADADTGGSGTWGSMEPQLQACAPGCELSWRDDSPERLAPVHEARLRGKGRGRALGKTPRAGLTSKLPHWFATLVASRGHWPPARLQFRTARCGRATLNFILLDTSASTLRDGGFARAKATALGIARQAYLDRDTIAILGFGNQQVQVLLPRSRGSKQLRQVLDGIPAGGGTPLREALHQSREWLAQVLRHDPELQVRTYLLTDGRCTDSVEQLALPGECLVIDVEQAPVKRGRASAIAAELQAEYLALPNAVWNS